MVPASEDIQKNFVALKDDLITSGLAKNINRSFLLSQRFGGGALFQIGMGNQKIVIS
ncbi:MAG: hypothetical protein IPL23_25605 [Saprospiraceae bacterium]|nr:hypothetical protein [Saprospiraceae bacterium]